MKSYKTRRNNALKIIQDVNHSCQDLAKSNDPFDNLLHSPLKQDVSFKPLSHWAQKVAELEKEEKKTRTKDLYELSSPEDCTIVPRKRVRKKPKPKRKENFNLYKLTSSKSRTSPKKIENEGAIIKERLLVRRAEKNAKFSPFAFNHKLPMFGLTSTPAISQRANVVKPSLFEFCSPLATDSTLKAKDTYPPNGCPESPILKNSSKSNNIKPSKIDFDDNCSLPVANTEITLPILNNDAKQKSFPSSGADESDECDAHRKSILRRKKRSTGDDALPSRRSKLETPPPYWDKSNFSGFSLNDLQFSASYSAVHELSDEMPLTDTDNNMYKNITFRRGNVKLSNTSKDNKIDDNSNFNDMTSSTSFDSRNVTIRKKRTSTVNKDVTPKCTSTTTLSPGSNAASINAENASGCGDHIQLKKGLNSDCSPNSGTVECPSDATSHKENTKGSGDAIGTEFSKYFTTSNSDSSPNAVPVGCPSGASSNVQNPGGSDDAIETKFSKYFTASNSDSSPYSVPIQCPPGVKTIIPDSQPSSSEDTAKEKATSVIRKSMLSRRETISRRFSRLGNASIFNATNLRLSSKVLMPGKSYKRSLSVLRKLENGQLALPDLFSQSEQRQGYLSFATSILEMQPEIEETLVNMSLACSPVVSRRPRTRALTAASRTKQKATLKSVTTMRTSNLFAANKTVRWQESTILENTRISSRRSQLMKSCLEQTHVDGNMSIRVVPTQDYEPTAFRSAYGICDKSTKDETIDEWSCEDVILLRCCQEAPVGFSEHFNENTLPECRKIGEGVYGEVFMYNSEDKGLTVFKVIPIEGDQLVNGEPQKTYEEILSEVVITMELSNLRYGEEQRCSGFAEVRKVWCVKGEYPNYLIDLWNDYDAKMESNNDTPTLFDESQLYIVLELANGGKDLESFVFENASKAAAAFQQAALSLAVAEHALEFEHRDFHWGNVLISSTEEEYVSYILDGVEYHLPTEGVKVTIIDYTLSRMTYNGCAVFNDLSVDPELFTAEGDYQFDIYRKMREETENNWQRFCPKTNIFWLHYTLDKMITMVRYQRPRSKQHTAGARKLRHWKMEILKFSDTSKFSTLFL